MTVKNKDKNKKEIVLDFSKASLNLILLLIVGLSFLVGFLFGRMSSSGTLSLKGSTKEESANPSAGGEMADKKRLSEIVRSLNLDEKKFKNCLTSEKYKNKVDNQFNEGEKAGIQGTPGGVFMDLKTGKKITIPGAVPPDTLSKIFNDLKKGKDDPNAPSVETPNPQKDHWRGPKDAKYVLVEYSDLECPFCDRFHPTAEEFLQNNKEVAWVYRHFPLRRIHPHAQKLAEASECVYEQKGDAGFWEFVDRVFEAMPGLEVDY